MELKVLILPLKVVGLIVLAVFARIFYDNNKLEEAKKDIHAVNVAFVLTRIVIGSLVFLLSFQ
jgi:ABC-type molybdate transport system permease subunit